MWDKNKVYISRCKGTITFIIQFLNERLQKSNYIFIIRKDFFWKSDQLLQAKPILDEELEILIFS